MSASQKLRAKDPIKRETSTWEKKDQKGKSKVERIQVSFSIFDRTIDLRVNADTTISEINRSLCSKHGCLPHAHFLTYQGRRLDDVMTLPDYHVKSGATLEVCIDPSISDS